MEDSNNQAAADDDELQVHYDWLVRQRSAIQEFLLDLWRAGLNKDRAESQTRILHLLLGVGFSLWRAVFLAEKPRMPKEVDRAAWSFLRKVIEDNSISFSDDRRWASWSVGYYLNNAVIRLQTISRRISGLASESAFAEIPAGLSGRQAREVWDPAFQLAQRALDRIKQLPASQELSEVSPNPTNPQGLQASEFDESN